MLVNLELASDGKKILRLGELEAELEIEMEI